MLKTTTASIQEVWNRPLEEFLNFVKQAERQYGLVIDGIDEWIKAGEAIEKESKHKEIQAYFDTKKFELVTLDRLFDSKWLNKTYKMSDIKKALDAAITEIYSNVKSLENIAEYGMIVKASYLQTLDISKALQQVEVLKANAERLAKEKAEREEREVAEQVRRNAMEERRDAKATAQNELAKNLVGEVLDIEPDAVFTALEIIEVNPRIRGTREQLVLLKRYLTLHGLAYEGLVIGGDDDSN
jgi:regulator of protease activity HflC (stomatin/prohibitin superfamily)